MTTKKFRLQIERLAGSLAPDAQTEKIQQPMPPPTAYHETTAHGVAHAFQSRNTILGLFDVVSAKNETMRLLGKDCIGTTQKFVN